MEDELRIAVSELKASLRAQSRELRIAQQEIMNLKKEIL